MKSTSYMSAIKTVPAAIAMSIFLLMMAPSAICAELPGMKMTTPIPQIITTPDKVLSSIGELEFVDGMSTT